MSDNMQETVILVIVGATILAGQAAYRALQARQAEQAAKAFSATAGQLAELQDLKPPSYQEISVADLSPPTPEELQANREKTQPLHKKLKQQDPMYRAFSGVRDDMHRTMKEEIQRTIVESATSEAMQVDSDD